MTLLSKPLIDRLCEQCNTPFTTIQAEISRGNGRFCSLSCSAKRQRKGTVYNCKCANCDIDLYRPPAKIAKNKIGLYFCNKKCMIAHKWRKIKIFRKESHSYGFCIECNEPVKRSGKIYCSPTCHKNNQYNVFIGEWLNGNQFGQSGEGGVSSYIRRWLFEKYDSKCQKCGWSEIHSITGKIPLTINHIDGDWANNHHDNLELICPNCHSLTINYGSLNKGKGRPKRLAKMYGV